MSKLYVQAKGLEEKKRAHKENAELTLRPLLSLSVVLLLQNQASAEYRPSMLRTATDMPFNPNNLRDVEGIVHWFNCMAVPTVTDSTRPSHRFVRQHGDRAVEHLQYLIKVACSFHDELLSVSRFFLALR